MAKINPVKVKQDADKLEKAGRLDQAIVLYRQVVEDNPRDWNTINKIGDLFGGNPNKQQELYVLGEQRIAQAARDSGLAQRAADNTRQMLIQMLRSLGYTSITVNISQP